MNLLVDLFILKSLLFFSRWTKNNKKENFCTYIYQCKLFRHAGHCWRSKDELISDVLLWTPTYGCAKVGRPARTYIQQLCEDTGCNSEDLPEAMNDREKWRERVRDIRAGGATWWWWWLYLYIHLYIHLNTHTHTNIYIYVKCL